MPSSPAIETLAQTTAEARFSLRIPPLKLLTSKEELVLARAASRRAPESPDLRQTLVHQLLAADAFDEAIALLDDRPDNNVAMLHMLTVALLARETDADNLRARETAESAVAASHDAPQQALTLTELAKACARLGDTARSEALLREALTLDPDQRNAYKRLFQFLLQRDVHEALAFAEATVAAGVRHSRVLGTLPLALTKLGRIEDARAAEGSREFAAAFDPAPPDGWPSLDAFNAALTEEASNHPDTRFDRYGVASTRTWRLDQPAIQRTRLFQELQKLIQREVERHGNSLPESTHPWVQAMPKTATLRNWTVIVEGDGYESWHVHQNGWMSGVYYIHVPDHIAHGTDEGGCIAFGLPDDIVGPEAAAQFGERLVRPHSGLMMIFPSHTFHRTYPHHGSGRRICYAFDIIPADETPT